MKLFSPKETEIALKFDESRNRQKAFEIAETADVLIKNFNALKEDIEKKKTEARIEFDSFAEKINSEKKMLLAELLPLEERKRKALEPLVEKENQLNVKEKTLKLKEEEISSKEQEVFTREEDIARLRESYEAKLDELGEREEGIRDREESQILKERDIQQAFSSFNQDFEVRSGLLNEKAQSIFDRESLVAQKEKAADIVSKEQQRVWEEISTTRKHIESQQRSLKNAFDEARSKNLL